MSRNMNHVDQYLASKLKEREQAGNLRQLTIHKAQVDFYSNDYLGLATTGVLASLMHPLSVGGHAVGSTGSRLLSGNSEHAEELERIIATFHKADAALLFNSGYDANIGLFASIADRHATILYDEYCHASIIDGIRLSLSSRKYKFRHNDLNVLEDKLKRRSDAGPVIVAVESVYSMDGDMAPLKDLTELCARYEAQLIVDEAHATGVVGAHGEGVVSSLGLQDEVFARVYTFGKALGCHGAAVIGGDLLKRYLINFARSFIYTTALPDHSIRAIQCAYEYLSDHSFTNQPLHDLITYFRSKINATGNANWKDSQSPIQALVTGDNQKTKQLATAMQQAGLQINPILHPTVPSGAERLRVCLHSFNTTEQVDLLFEKLK